MNIKSGERIPVSREELVEFLRDMSESARVSPADWENHSLERFMGAWAAWLSDIDGYFLNRQQEVPEEPTWGLIAEMVLAARVYE